MSEPLKDKIQPIRWRTTPGHAYPGGTWCGFCNRELCRGGHKGFEEDQVKEAVEWLKEHIGKHTAFIEHLNALQQVELFDKIDEAFGDVTK